LEILDYPEKNLVEAL